MVKNKSYLKFFSYGNIGMQLGVCFGHLMFDLKLFLQFFKLDAALVPTTNQGLVRRSNNSTQAQRVLGTAQNHYFQAILKGFLWLNKSWFPVCSVQREWWFGLRRFYEYEKQAKSRPPCVWLCGDSNHKRTHERAAENQMLLPRRYDKQQCLANNVHNRVVHCNV